MKKLKLAKWQWKRDPRNPILPPVEGSAYDSGRCMNPFVVRIGDQYRLYYSGTGSGMHRICLATMSVSDPGKITRHGPVLEIGEKGRFDCNWCVLPMVLSSATNGICITAGMTVLREDYRLSGEPGWP